MALFSVSSCYAQEINDNQSRQVFLTYKKEAPFIFMGKVDPNKAGNAAAIMYPGDNALVFFAAIMTHAAINSGANSAKLSKEQEDANRVLEDYQPYIAKFNTGDNAVLPQLDVNTGSANETISFVTNAEAKSTAGWEMNVSPVFFMTQNFGSLILYNKVVFQEVVANQPKTKRQPARSTARKSAADPNEKVIVVISDPIADADFRHFWSNNDGARFLDTLKLMYKESLSLLLASKLSRQPKENVEQVTVKYMEDGVKKIERGYVITSSCKRTLFESLSGEIKSVPNLDFLNCPPAT